MKRKSIVIAAALIIVGTTIASHVSWLVASGGQVKAAETVNASTLVAATPIAQPTPTPTPSSHPVPTMAPLPTPWPTPVPVLTPTPMPSPVISPGPVMPTRMPVHGCNQCDGQLNGSRLGIMCPMYCMDTQ